MEAERNDRTPEQKAAEQMGRMLIASNKRWADLALTMGMAPEIGLRAGELARSIDTGMSRLGFISSDDPMPNDQWRKDIDNSPEMTRLKQELDSFAKASPGHANLAGIALFDTFDRHPLSEELRPSATPEPEAISMTLDGLERAMSIAGRGVLHDDPKITDWLRPTGQSARDVREDLAALGLSEQQQTAALMLGDRLAAAWGPLTENEQVYADLKEFAEQGDNALVAASYVMHLESQTYAKMPAEIGPDWMLDAAETAGRIAEAVERTRANEEPTIELDLDREQSRASQGQDRADDAGTNRTDEERQEQAPADGPSQAPENKDRELGDGQASDEDKTKRKVSTELGDVPDSIRKRYYVQESKALGEVSFLTDPQSPKAAFRDTGAKLIAHETNMAVVKDMVATAEHRGWDSIKATGANDFRKAVWLEASQRGIEVTGYRPTDLDKQELTKLLDAREGRTIEPGRERTQAATTPADREKGQEAPPAARGAEKDGPRSNDKLDYDKGVSGVLVGQGTAPYQHKAGEEQSAYVKLETEPGKTVEIWGVGLPEAIKNAGVGLGDTVTVRRDGREIVQKDVKVTDKATGQQRTETRDVPRNKWEVVADRFRNATPGEAARDPELKGAQATFKTVETMLNHTVADKGLREKLIAVAKEHVANKLQGGPGEFKQQKVRQERANDPTRQNRRTETRVKAQAETKRHKVADKADPSKVRKTPDRSRSR